MLPPVRPCTSRQRGGLRQNAGRLAAIAALCLGSVSAAGCTPDARPPSMVVVVIDSLRADHLHHAGDPRPLSPNLDAVAAAGTRFTAARSAAPWTTPSVMSMFTGLTPPNHHVDNNDRALDPSVPTLAERLRAAGYATGAVMPALTLAEHFGFGRGFDTFVIEPQGHGGVSAPWTLGHAFEFLRRNGDRPFFLYIHLWDVHYNYNPPVPYAVRFQAGRPAGPGETDDITAHLFSNTAPPPAERLEWLESQYAGEIFYTDDQVGRLLEELNRLGLGEDTLLVVTADHGEAFLEHGVMGHTVQLFDEMIRVPLLWRWPGRIPAGLALPQPVSLVSLAPTLLELAGLPVPGADFDSGSLAPRLRPSGLHEGEAGEAPPAAVLAATSRRADRRGLMSQDSVYIYDFAADEEMLFDLLTDPGQLHDLAASRPQEARQGRLSLCAELARRPLRGEIPIALMEEGIRRELDAGLRSLGYVGGSSGGPTRTQEPQAERRLYLEALGCPPAP